ncbi:MAG: aminotransferase class I/II-fold pyridoxal phosphate-dependent enzyme [Erysipelotrichaceae bacterium]|nr:aminotransferase class I/II-fold pyridoxal phosphate-dependent enzyme [Erysipelotrichaceae bacterium]
MFYKQGKEVVRFVDGVFAISNAAKADKDPSTVNASVGSLFNEDGVLATFNTVFDSYNKVDNRTRAAYAKSPAGNPEFRKVYRDYVLEGRCQGEAVAVAGGTAALSLAVEMCLNEGETVIAPAIAWGNYQQIIKEHGLKSVTYDIYDVDDLVNKIESAERAFVIVNSPCQNPTGHSYTYEEWQKITKALNSKKEAILLNDVAYLDYAFDKDAKKYMELFNELNETVLVLMACSCSKTFSYYGQRLGALMVIHKDAELVDLFVNQCEKHIRTTYASCNNACMTNITDVLENHLEEFNEEKNFYKDLLEKRAKMFIAECDEQGIEYYPYKEGFFVTLKMPNNEYRDQLHQRMLDNHIYCIKLNMGIRVGICATPFKKLEGLAKRIKDLM